jgi:hypothetical protein
MHELEFFKADIRKIFEKLNSDFSKTCDKYHNIPDKIQVMIHTVEPKRNDDFLTLTLFTKHPSVIAIKFADDVRYIEGFAHHPKKEI